MVDESPRRNGNVATRHHDRMIANRTKDLNRTEDSRFFSGRDSGPLASDDTPAPGHHDSGDTTSVHHCGSHFPSELRNHHLTKMYPAGNSNNAFVMSLTNSCSRGRPSFDDASHRNRDSRQSAGFPQMGEVSTARECVLSCNDEWYDTEDFEELQVRRVNGDPLSVFVA